MYVDKRHIEVSRFILVLENGRQIRIREMEGRIRQNSRVTFDVDRRGGVRIAEILIEALTEAGQSGRAQVSVSVLHQSEY